jgi:hypothetical protein
MFRWTCFVVAVLMAALVLLMLNDIRVTAKTNLIEIAQKSKVSAETLAEVSKDIKELRKLAGVTGPRDKSFVVYANSVLDFLETNAQGGKVGIKEAMKKSEPVADWIGGVRKEAIYLVLTEKSKSAILCRLCQTAPPFRADFYLQLPGQAPVKLEDWLRANHPESRALETPANEDQDEG